jgi:Zn-dependent M32 family carboxypeptidase
LKTFVAVALFLTITGQVCSAQSEPQSLADVARQNKQNQKAAVIITEDNIAASEGVVSVVGDESVRVSGPTTASSQKTAAGKDNAAPSDSNTRVAALKKQLDSYRAEQQTWKDSAKRYEGLLANTTDDFRRASYEQMLDNNRKSVASLQQKIDQTNVELAKAQQQAAAAGSKGGQSSGNTPPAGPQP